MIKSRVFAFSELIRPIPIPSYKSNFLFRSLLGHLPQISKCAKENNKTFLGTILLKRKEWYKEVNSDIIALHIANKRLVLVSDPELVKQIMRYDETKIVTSGIYRFVFKFLMPTSIVSLSGDEWYKIRKVTQQAINNQKLDNMISDADETLKLAFVGSLTMFNLVSYKTKTFNMQNLTFSF